MKDHHLYEEEQFFNIKKENRFARKLASKLDRSQFKKTDQRKKEQIQNNAVQEHLISGIVIRIQGQEIFVQADDKIFVCTLRGIFKKGRPIAKSAVIVGDRVFLEEHSHQQGVIHTIAKRTSVLRRADHLSQKKEHPIVANVDLVLITTSVVDPLLRPSIIDRYLIAAMQGGLHAAIIVNKEDLLGQEHESQKELLEECRRIYPAIGIPFLTTSTQSSEGLEELKALMKDKISVFAGQSGSGKSSLINKICDLDLKVGKTVERYKKGSHTTTYTQLLPLPMGGFVVDTPGIKSFGVWKINPDHLKDYFPEISQAGKHCLFSDCKHRGEVGCAIPEAIKQGDVSTRRYLSYKNILDTLIEKHLRR